MVDILLSSTDIITNTLSIAQHGIQRASTDILSTFLQLLSTSALELNERIILASPNAVL